MSLLSTLQRRTLPTWQLLGFSVTLFIGLFIIGITAQLNADINQVFTEEKAVFGKQGIVVTKKISVFKTMDKERIYFNDADINELRAQPFVTELASFDKARFNVQAFTKEGGEIPGFRTDLFFEAIPDDFLDVHNKRWHWSEGDAFVPIIVPQDYISLYNFGFAESQGLPVISENMIGQVEFGLRIRGNGEREEFRAGIVAFSEQINSILVPQSFLDYGNRNYAIGGSPKPSRLLVRLNDPSNTEALKYFSDSNLDVSNGDLEQGRLRLFLQMVFTALFLISGIIIALSISSIILSMNLLLYKNKATINNLFLIGYSNQRIARFYALATSLLVTLSAVLAVLAITWTHGKLLGKIQDYLNVDTEPVYAALVIGISAGLVLVYYLLLRRRIAKLNGNLL